MSCPKCKRRMSREWHYCPYCGLRIERQGIFGGLDKLVKGVFNNLFNNNPKRGFTIRVKTGPQTQKGSQASAKQKLMRMPKELIEPKVQAKRRGEELEISIELPGINSLNNVNLMHLGESLEVRAVKDDKGYFKIINIPADYRVINKSLSNEVLLVRMRGK